MESHKYTGLLDGQEVVWGTYEECFEYLCTRTNGEWTLPGDAVIKRDDF